MAKSKKQEELEQKLSEMTADLQRTRADFENYRKRMDADRTVAFQHGQTAAIMKLLPVIDNIERATSHLPGDLTDNKWAQGVAGLVKNLEKSLADMNVRRIESTPGTLFNPEFHEAIQVDDTEGDQEVIAEELQAGYTLSGTPIRHAMVKVTRTKA